MATITRDLGYYNATWQQAGVGSASNVDWLADASLATEVIITNLNGDVLGGHFGVGPDVINYPTDIPSGYVLSDVQYVMIAYSEAGGTITADTSTWGYTPNPETWPFIQVGSQFRSTLHQIDHLPVGGYAGEVVGRFSDLGAVTSGQPFDVIFGIDTDTTFSPVHIAYWAMRLTYTGPDEPPPATTEIPHLKLTRRDDLRLTGRRSRQGSNRLTGYL